MTRCGEGWDSRDLSLFAEDTGESTALSSINSCHDVPNEGEWREGAFEFVMSPTGILSLLALWVAAGIALFMSEMGFDWVDSVYLTAQIITTVGYGDLTWTHTTLNMSFFIGFVMFSTFASGGIMSAWVDKFMKQRLHDIYLQLALQAKARRGPLGRRGSEEPEKDVLQVVSRKKFESASLVFFLFVCAGVVLFTLDPVENDSIAEALYSTVITLSTVGFGDQAVLSKTGKLICSIWMVFGTFATANFVAAFVEEMLGTKQSIRMKELSLNELDAMDADHDGRVTPHEFLIYILRKEGLVSDAVLSEIDDNFNALDSDGTGTLSMEDVHSFTARRM